MHDIAVIGLGTWGASALWQAAERGVNAVGIEQYDRAHQLGSSHGHTRLFRVACMEHPALGAVAVRAAELWERLGESNGTRLLERCGVITVGAPDSDYVRGAVATARSQGIEIETYSAAELQERHPAFENLRRDEIGVLDPSGGVLQAEGSTLSSLARAEELGARILTGSRVQALRRGVSAIGVQLSSGTVVEARRVVVTMGPWLAAAAGFEGVHALQTAMNWFSPAQGDAERFDVPSLPGFIRRFDDLSIWGHGSLGHRGVKAGLSLNSKSHIEVDPSRLDREVVPERDWKELSAAVQRVFPALDETPAATRPCMITMSPDHQFIIGALTREPRVVVATGCSGHGFKHSSAIGEYAVQTALGEETTVSPGIWDPARFPGLDEALLDGLFVRAEPGV